MVGWFRPVETLTVDSTIGSRYKVPNRARCTTWSTSTSWSMDLIDVTWVGW